MLPEGRSQNFGVRRHDCALERRDMSRWGKATPSSHNWVQRHAGFSDTNWVQNWVKLGSFSFFEKVEIDEIVNV